MTELQQVWLLPLAFLFELLVSQSIFLFHLPRRKHFPFRAVMALMIGGGLSIGMNYVFSLLPHTIPIRMFFFLAFCCVPMGMVYACFPISFSQVLFVAVAGYSVEHITDSLIKIVIALNDTASWPSWVQIAGLMFLPYIGGAAILYFLFVKPAQLDEKLDYSDRRVLFISLINLGVCLCLSVVMDFLVLAPAAIVLGKIHAILGCVLCLLLQVGIFRDGKMAQTNQMLQQMMQMERNQHRISKETIELINIKCHDLKHQIDWIDRLSSEKKAELSQAILIYDSIAKTGSDALDIVLMEKKLLCEKYHIQFTYMADGVLLKGMEDVDIYSLFGNMLDNAIESLQHEPDEEKRLITLQVKGRMKMIYISVDNYCSTPVIMKDGELQTTKAHEPGFHGYGVKSIAYIVSSHGGDLLIKNEDNHFTLEIVLPGKED